MKVKTIIWRSFPWRQILYLLPLFPFLGWLRVFLYPSGSEYSDLAISHLPNSLYLHSALIEFRTIPLWSPAILGGYPFFANPLSGLWYPPGWLTVAWPEPWAFNLLAGLHLVFGAYGMGRLVKALGLCEEAQWFGAIAFGMMPKLFSHFAAGHITLVYAVVWTPWLLLAEIRPLKGWVRAEMLLAVITLADPRWGAYSWGFWLAWSFVRRKDIQTWFWRIAIGSCIAMLLAAPILLPLIEYSRLSTRSAITSAETLAFSLPPANFIGLFIPTPNAEWQIYPGMLTLLFAGGALVQSDLRKRTRFWLVTAIFALVFSLGETIPGVRLWASLPVAGMLRVPARVLFIFSMSVCVLACYALDALLLGSITSRARFRWNLLIVGVAAVWISINVFFRQFNGWDSFVGLAILMAFFTSKLVKEKREPGIGLIFLFAILFLDLFVLMDYVSTPRSPTEVYTDGLEAVSWLADQPGEFRVYSPSYSLPQHTAARYGLELVNGVDPLQLQSYADFMADASGVPNKGYSIPLPAIDGDPATANRGAVLNHTLLAWLNVRYLAADFQLPAAGLKLVERFGETRIYENTIVKGMVWRLGDDGAVEPVAPVRLTRSPNRIDLWLDEPGSYFLSEIDYPGWQVDGAEKLPSYRGVFRAFEVGEDASQVSFVFRPVSLYAGIGFFLVGLSVVLLRRYAIPD